MASCSCTSHHIFKVQGSLPCKRMQYCFQSGTEDPERNSSHTSHEEGLALEPVAVAEYCRVKNTNYWPCGFVIHPDAPWLGTSPDGVVFDPLESPPFGLLEIKCPNVQGQLLLTGLDWCDFVVLAEDDLLVQRIYKDAENTLHFGEGGQMEFDSRFQCSQELLGCQEKRRTQVEDELGQLLVVTTGVSFPEAHTES
ncbi:hypothetical protein WMY93_024201 [Mugilogobius chulae]|uniref:YqaJ viral recombinase domain-containing protein n=1 Tax=Mugilogobius chulae TaxID=88201 RepID=A0AAW0MYX6_9GOBI